MLRRTAAPVVAAAIGSGVATATVTLVPQFRFAYRHHDLHVSLETAAALIGLLAAYLLFGRFQRRRRLDDLALFIALSLFAFTNLFFGAVPAMVADGGSGTFATWAAVCGRFLGAVAVAVAAFAPARRLQLSRRATGLVLAVPVLFLATAAIAVGMLVPVLPSGVETSFSPETSARPHLVGHPAVLAVQLVGATLFAAAAAGFVRRSRRQPDPFVRSLGVASVFAAFARLNYFLYPSLYTEWVYTGDAFRLLFYAVILGAALWEISAYWKVASEAAVLEERRRVARDLHDGLAQELAFVARNLRRLEPQNMYVQRASAGIVRGLEDARRAIAALSDPVDEPLDVTLARVANDVAAREGTSVELALASAVHAPLETREALVRIVSEAITNAARHGCADLVHVQLEQRGRIRLRVTDSGRGFDFGAGQDRVRRGYGLRGMRERVLALGGEFRLTTEPGRGAELEVVV